MFDPRSKGVSVVPIVPSRAAESWVRYGTSMSTMAWSQNGAGSGTSGGFGGVPGPGFMPPMHDVLFAPSDPDGPGVTNCTDFEMTPGPLPGRTDRNVFAYELPKLAFSWNRMP